MFLDKIKEEKESLENLPDSLEKSDDQLDEVAPHRKRVVRQGKVIRKRVCAPGYRRVGNRCVRMKSSERHKRRMAAVHNDRKNKAQRARTRRRSNRIRHNHHM